MTLQMQWAVEPIAFGESFNLNFQSQSGWSLFNGTWQKRPRELDHRMLFEKQVQHIALEVSFHINVQS